MWWRFSVPESRERSLRLCRKQAIIRASAISSFTRWSPTISCNSSSAAQGALKFRICEGGLVESSKGRGVSKGSDSELSGSDSGGRMWKVVSSVKRLSKAWHSWNRLLIYSHFPWKMYTGSWGALFLIRSAARVRIMAFCELISRSPISIMMTFFRAVFCFNCFQVMSPVISSLRERLKRSSTFEPVK